MLKRALLTTAAIVLAGALSAAPVSAAAPPPAPVPTFSVPMKKDGGVYVIPVEANGIASFVCIIDSGASDVNMPDSVFQKLLHAGSVSEADFIGTQDYTLADGSSQRGRTYRIKSLKVGNVVVHNVVASIGGDSSSGLLGQSFLERFRSWSLNNADHTLVLTGTPSDAPATVAPHGPVTGPHPNDGPVSVAQGGPAPHPTAHPPHTTPSDSGDSSGDTSQTGPSSDGSRQPSEDDQLTAQHSD